jgi:transcription elongation GreA/GreB family factor
LKLPYTFVQMSNVNKTELAAFCGQILEERMKDAETAMLSAQESANTNEKSSMGDKYETGREMSMQERDLHAKQLDALQKEYRKLKVIDVLGNFKKIETGALVQTETKWYWVAIALGQVKFEKGPVMVVSPLSPIAQQMIGKRANDFIEMNGKREQIIAVF